VVLDEPHLHRDGSNLHPSDLVEVVRFASLVEIIAVGDVTRARLKLIELGDDVSPHRLRHRRSYRLTDLDMFTGPALPCLQHDPRDAARDTVRMPAVHIVAETGCTCQACKHTRMPQHYLLPSKVLGLDAPTVSSGSRSVPA
jgi:hypothetical protein